MGGGLFLLATAAALAGAGDARATAEEALATAFGAGVAIERRTHVLTAAELALVRERSGERVEQELWTELVALRDGRPVGRAWLDTHVVRTLRETVLVALAPEGTVRRVEIVVFFEPPDYRPRQGWLDQFNGRKLDADLDLDRAIRPITGASLSSRAATAAVRRVLAVDAVLQATPAAPAPSPGPQR